MQNRNTERKARTVTCIVHYGPFTTGPCPPEGCQPILTSLTNTKSILKINKIKLDLRDEPIIELIFFQKSNNW